MKKQTVAATLMALGWSLMAFGAEIGPYKQEAFNPSQGESFSIPVIVDQSGEVVVEIRTPDRDKVRVLRVQVDADQVGEPVPVFWDGRDEEGNVVPDEAYTPVLKAGDGIINNPFEYSGGEVIDSIRLDFSDRGIIGFKLEQPSRVLIRAGIEGGPLMRTLMNWRPRVSGKNIVRWNGYDQDKVVNLMEDSGLRVLLTGYQLPEHSIITTGSGSNYVQWRTEKDWPDRMPEPDEITLAREGKRLSRHFFLPRALEHEPRVRVTVNQKSLEEGPVDVKGQFRVRVDLDPEDQWFMDQSQYEIAFFLDGEFLAEEEQGYVPFNWLWNASGLTPGRHTLTVNLSSFNGAVGVQTLELNVVDESQASVGR